MRAARALLVALAVLALAACTAIPTSGPVKAGPTEQPDHQNLVFVPNPPADGADPQAIVQGFVYAATAGRPYTIAKEFLTGGFAKRWNPNARVLVHDSSWTTAAAPDGRVVLTVRTSGRVDGNGSYQPSVQQEHLTFQLAREDGQWRIASAPDGVLLASNVFQKIFVPSKVQFFDPTWTRLVPDFRWFPQHSDQTAVIVRALIAGQSAPIGGGATRNAFPAGTVFRGTTVTGAQTAVALAVPGAPDARTIERMQQQLSGSLGGGPGQIRLLVNGRQAPTAPQLTAPQNDLSPVVLLTDGRFGTLSDKGVLREDTTPFGRRIEALRPSAVTVSARQGVAAVLTGSGRVAIVTSDGERIVDSRGALVAPSLDQEGWVYSVPSADPNGLRATDAKGDSIDLSAGLDGATVKGIEVSPDGTRMLVLEQTQDGTPEAFVFGITRAADGSPSGLSNAAYPVGFTADVATSATWINTGSVAVLTSDSDGTNQAVTQQNLGGVSTNLEQLPAAKQLVGVTSAPNDLRALLQNGELYERSSDSSGWEQEFAAPVTVSLLAVQR